jgi:hypothetical protein
LSVWSIVELLSGWLNDRKVAVPRGEAALKAMIMKEIDQFPSVLDKSRLNVVAQCGCSPTLGGGD